MTITVTCPADHSENQTTGGLICMACKKPMWEPAGPITVEPSKRDNAVLVLGEWALDAEKTEQSREAERRKRQGALLANIEVQRTLPQLTAALAADAEATR